MEIVTEPKQWIIRPAGPKDISFVYATWLRSYRTGSGLGLIAGKHAYFTLYQHIIDFILQKDTTTVSVAALEANPSVVLGYAVTEPKILHYVFVKEAFRRFGIAKDLYRSAFEKAPAITHITKIGREIIGDLQDWKLRPELIFKGE